MANTPVSDFFRDIEFQEFIEALWDGGWYHIVFPFMLVYAIVFTILNQVDIFKDKKPVKVIVALVFALFAIAFPITGEGGDSCIDQRCGETLGDLMMALFPGVTAFTMGVLALYIVAAMLGVDLVEFFGNKDKDKNIVKWIVGALGLLVVLYYYARGFGWDGFSDSDWWLDDVLTDPLLYILVMFGLFFWWVTKDDESTTKKKKDNDVHVNVGGDHHH